MRAVVLSGGGAKGSYQIGVWKALKRLHLSYDIVTGTSIGALNGALMVQKDYRLAKKLWQTLNLKYLFEQTPKKSNNFEVFKLYEENFFKNGGMDTSKVEEIIRKAINPYKFYHSKINYGLVTYNLTNKKTRQMKKEQIPKDKLCDYLMASATCYPAFQMKEIEGDKYIDGGISDNLPMNLALQMGAQELIVVDLKAPGIKKKAKQKVPITYITPSQPITFFLNFDEHEAIKNIKLGYNDTLKAFNKLDGKIFTFHKKTLDRAYLKLEKKLKERIQYIFAKNTIPFAIKTLKKLENNQQYISLFRSLTEDVGNILEVDTTKIYFFYKYKKELKKKLFEIEENKQFKKDLKAKKFKNLINTKWIVLYLYKQIKKENWKAIKYLSFFFKQDLLRAIYLSVVI